MKPTRWAFPVASPWTARRYGRPVALLSVRQHELYVAVRTTIRWGPRTLEDLARLADNPSRGRVHSELRRLRQLEILGTYARKGRHGRTYLWIPRHTRTLAKSLAGRRLSPSRGNDSASTPTGTYLSRQGLERSFRMDGMRHRGGAPPRSPRRRDGRRRCPRFLWGSCPSGHRLRMLSVSWTVNAAETVLEGRWRAVCPRCGLEAIERVHAEHFPPVRALSPEERTDPARFAARQAAALEYLADPGLNPETRRELERTYLSRDREAAGG